MSVEQRAIVIVDDEQEICELVSQVLAPLGEPIVYETDPVRAVELISKSHPVAVITDYRMPSMNGVEFCCEIKAIHPDVPIILLTGNADKDVAIAALRAGIEDIVEKPFRSEDLRARIKKWVERAKTPVNLLKSIKPHEEKAGDDIHFATDSFELHLAADSAKMIMTLMAIVVSGFVAQSSGQRKISVKHIQEPKLTVLELDCSWKGDFEFRTEQFDLEFLREELHRLGGALSIEEASQSNLKIRVQIPK